MSDKGGNHQIQEAYIVAKSNLEELEEQQRIIEQSYISSNQIINYEHCDDCLKSIIDSGLWAKIIEARKMLKVAEDELLEYGMNIFPKNGKRILEKAVLENLNIRKKVIELVLKLDLNIVKPL